MNVILLLAIIAACSLKNVFTRYCSVNGESNSSVFFFNLLASAAALIISFPLFFQKGWECNGYVLLIGLLLGLANLMVQFLYIKALSKGEMSLSTLFYTCGFLLPTMIGTIVWQEAINWIQVAGVILIVISLTIGTVDRKKQTCFSREWLLYALGCLFMSGIVSIIQKVFAESTYANQYICMNQIAYLVMVLVSGAGLGLCYAKENKNWLRKMTQSRFVIFTVLTGILSLLIAILCVYLAGRISSIVLYPCMNGGTFLATTACALIIFREKCTRAKLIGLIMGLLGTLLAGNILAAL